MAKDISEIFNNFRKEDILRMIPQMKTIMIRYLGEGEMVNSEILYEASLLLDNLHEYLLQEILVASHRGLKTE